MVEIHSWEQVEALQNSPFKKYLLHTRIRTQQEPWDFQNWGSWVIVEKFEMLHETIRGTHFMLPSIEEGLFDGLELVEKRFGVYELLFLLDTDFGVSLLLLDTEDVPEAYRTILNSHIR
jgi:hypothetical protein